MESKTQSQYLYILNVLAGLGCDHFDLEDFSQKMVKDHKLIEPEYEFLKGFIGE